MNSFFGSDSIDPIVQNEASNLDICSRRTYKVLRLFVAYCTIGRVYLQSYGANRTTFLWYQNNFGSVKNPLYLARLHGRLSSRVEARLGRFLCFLIYLGVRMHIMNIQRKLKHARTLLCSHFSTSAVLQNVGKMAYRLARARTRSASPHEA